MTDAELESRAMAILEAALDMPEPERARFVAEQSYGDGVLERRVMALLDADAHTRSALMTGGAAAMLQEGAAPLRVGPYRIVGLIGKGGMGSVYEGVRDAGDFELRVAIKVIRSGALDPVLVERFNRERQIHARLSHPNVARLFDGGALPDGSPYFVMEYIDGQPVLDWSDESGIGREHRLRLFRDICAAVHYVHQSLVIHRDITPGNVLVTSAGIVKLIDFGISRPGDTQASGQDKPEGRSASYTPGYAAPERRSGAGATVLSDVYSLGRLLSDLVGPQPPGSELAEIISTAMKPQPADRYSSVDALSQDVLALMEKRPVRAVQGGAGYVAARFLARHPLAVSAAAMVVVGLIGALALTTSLYREAEAERQAANQRFEEVRELAQFMMFDLYDELAKVTGNTRATEMIANTSLTYLESLRRDPRAPLEVALQTAAGYQRLADVLGNPTAPNLGERATTTSMLDAAIASLEDLNRRYPFNEDVMRRLAEANFSGATHAYVADDDNHKALALARRAAGLYDDLVSRGNATEDDQRNRLRARLMAAVPLPWIGMAEQGVAELKQVNRDAASLQNQYPDNVDIEQFTASVNVELARAVIRLRDAGDGDESTLAYWDEAIRIRERGFTLNPDDMRPYRALATIYYERGAERRTFNDLSGALEDMARAREIVDALLARDPTDTGLVRLSGGILDETAKTLAYAGRSAEAVAMIPAALKSSAAQLAATPGNPGNLREYAYSLTLYADIYDRAGLSAEKCAMVADARKAWDATAAAQPLSDLDLATSSANLATLDEGCAP